LSSFFNVGTYSKHGGNVRIQQVSLTVALGNTTNNMMPYDKRIQS